MTSTCICAWAVALVLLPIIVLLHLTESQTQRIRRLRRRGWTQQKIADHIGVSRSTVRRRLGAAF